MTTVYTVDAFFPKYTNCSRSEGRQCLHSSGFVTISKLPSDSDMEKDSFNPLTCHRGK